MIIFITTLIQSFPSLDLPEPKTNRTLFIEFIRARYPKMKITFPKTNEVRLLINCKWEDPECIILCKRIGIFNKHSPIDFNLKIAHNVRAKTT